MCGEQYTGEMIERARLWSVFLSLSSQSRYALKADIVEYVMIIGLI